MTVSDTKPTKLWGSSPEKIHLHDIVCCQETPIIIPFIGTLLAVLQPPGLEATAYKGHCPTGASAAQGNEIHSIRLYKDRLMYLNLLPLMRWYELLDITFAFKSLTS